MVPSVGSNHGRVLSLVDTSMRKIIIIIILFEQQTDWKTFNRSLVSAAMGNFCRVSLSWGKKCLKLAVVVAWNMRALSLTQRTKKLPRPLRYVSAVETKNSNQ